MSDNILKNIKTPQDLKKLNRRELSVLAGEIRSTILKTVAVNGGHLSSNLGIVEVTIALHRVFSSPKDSIIWDVGHQCYPHKLLTGRFKTFHTIRQKDGLSGFPKYEESIHDIFNTGHASTSISAAIGILEGRNLQGVDGKAIAVIGDGALTGGMAFEAILNAGSKTKDLIVILNDNKMSISKSTGAFSRYLSSLTMHQSYQRFRYLFDTTLEKIPLVGTRILHAIRRMKRAIKGLFFKNNVFVDLGFEYVGPLNGHNEKQLEKVFTDVKKMSNPVVIHIETKKGYGYLHAEHDPSKFHGIGPFNLSDGKVDKSDTKTFSTAFSETMIDLASKDSSIVCITAAMLGGTGLSKFANHFPNRCFDVGIAEGHAVTFGAGLVVSGMKPIVALYSTFLQRAIDQIVHDVAIQNLPVVFAIDRAGAVPYDGETHQGLFDISILRSIPNVAILCPASYTELKIMFEWALQQNHPIAIRYPKTGCPKEIPVFSEKIVCGRGVFVRKKANSKLLIICTGGVYKEVKEAVDNIAYKGQYADIYNLRFAKPIDEDYFFAIVESYSAVLFIEDGIKIGGVSEYLSFIMMKHCPNIVTKIMAFPDMFYPQGSREEVLEFTGLSMDHIEDNIDALLDFVSINTATKNEKYL